MKINVTTKLFMLLLVTGILPTPLWAQAEDVLSAWQNTDTRKTIVTFVEEVTEQGAQTFVPPHERIAVFDNDGTLWSEQPAYFQLFFAIDRMKVLASDHPEWKTEEPYASVLKGDMKAVLAGGEEAIGKLVMATHAGMTTEEFAADVKQWISSATHPKTGKPYTKMVFKPMLQLIDYLQANGFKTYIVSGGGIEFIRPWAEDIYGIPPEHVVGSSIKTEFTVRNGEPVLVRLPELNFVDDKEGKPIGINMHIGRKPILAFGNSDGDRQMLEWTGAGDGNRLMLLLHHDDASREWAYDTDSKVGTFSDALMDHAARQGWTVVSMKDDWNIIYEE